MSAAATSRHTPRTTPVVYCVEPLQSARCVYGLRIKTHPQDPCSIVRDITLAVMDAPELLPAGSMVGEDYPGYGNTSLRVVRETNIRRDASFAGWKSLFLEVA